MDSSLAMVLEMQLDYEWEQVLEISMDDSMVDWSEKAMDFWLVKRMDCLKELALDL